MLPNITALNLNVHTNKITKTKRGTRTQPLMGSVSIVKGTL